GGGARRPGSTPRGTAQEFEYGMQPPGQSASLAHASPRFSPELHRMAPLGRVTHEPGFGHPVALHDWPAAGPPEQTPVQVSPGTAVSQSDEPIRMNISSSVVTPPVRVQASHTPSLAPGALSQTRSSPLQAIAVPSAARLFRQ